MRGIATGFPPCHNYYSAMQSGNPDTLKVGEGGTCAYSPLIHTDYYIFVTKTSSTVAQSSGTSLCALSACSSQQGFIRGGGGGGGGGAGIRGIFDVKNTCRLSVSGIDICLFMCRFMQWCLSMLIFLKLHLNNES